MSQTTSFIISNQKYPDTAKKNHYYRVNTNEKFILYKKDFEVGKYQKYAGSKNLRARENLRAN